MPVAVCTVLNSWWWTERPSETCRVSFQNKIIWYIGSSSWFYYRNDFSVCLHCCYLTEMLDSLAHYLLQPSVEWTLDHSYSILSEQVRLPQVAKTSWLALRAMGVSLDVECIRSLTWWVGLTLMLECFYWHWDLNLKSDSFTRCH